VAAEEALGYLYLGFWIEGHPKMHYKARYRPLEILQDGAWHEFEPSPTDA
jgi:arginine-tRNA-protein transferase